LTTDPGDVLARIAGNVVVSPNPGVALRVWRERLAIRQVALARQMGVSPSVLSDYESGRRSSPGVVFVRRYVEALARLDSGSNRVLERLAEPKDQGAVLALGEFHRATKAKEVARRLEAEVLRGDAYLDRPIYGFTVLDSIRAIYALSGFDFYRLFGGTTERVVVFTKVGMGRSPLVAIRVSHLKPRMVVLHGPRVIDPLALDLADRENLILARSDLSSEKRFGEIFAKM
jgi:putative transcriptional regulator